MLSKTHSQSVSEYNAKNYKPIMCRFKIQDLAAYDEYATKCSISTNGMITSCINYCINNNIDITGGIKLNQSGVYQQDISAGEEPVNTDDNI